MLLLGARSRVVRTTSAVDVLMAGIDYYFAPHAGKK
jgi:hypothetical protein